MDHYKRIYSKRKYGRLLLWISISLIYSLTALFHLAGPNPTSRFALVKTFSLSGNTWFPEDWISTLWIGPDYAQLNNKFFSDKSPGLSLLFIPVYLIVNFLLGNIVGLTPDYMVYTEIDEFFVSIVQIMLSFINAWAIVRFFDILKKFNFPSRFALFCSLIFAFSSLFFVYASVFVPHSLIGTFLLEIFYRLLLIKDQTYAYSNVVIIGLLLGIGSVIDYVMLFIIPLSCLFILIPLQEQKTTFNLENFNKSYISRLKEWLQSNILLNRIIMVIVLLFTSFFGFLPFFIYNFISFGNFTTTAYQVSHWYADLNFYTSFEDGFNIMILGKFGGLIYLTPVVILAFWGFYYFAKEFRQEFLFSFGTFWIFLYFYSKYFTPYGGLYGSRYIVPSLSFLFLGLAFFLYKKQTNRILVASSAFLIGISVINNIISMWISKDSPFWSVSAEHPIFNTGLRNLGYFIEGDVEWFRSGIYRMNPFLFLLILTIAITILLILLRKSEKAFPKMKEGKNFVYTEKLNVELNIWFSLVIFIFTSSFLYHISIILSKGYNEKVLKEIGSFYWNYRRPKPPLFFYDISVTEFLLLFFCLASIFYYIKKLIHLKKEEMKSNRNPQL